MEFIEAVGMGLVICFISFMGFMVSVVIQLDKIQKEQEKITQYIPYDYLEKGVKHFKKDKT